MTKRMINRLLKLIGGGGTHTKEGLNSLTNNPYKVGFSFVLDSSAMARFKEEALKLLDRVGPVSYTHLTLPTIA